MERQVIGLARGEVIPCAWKGCRSCSTCERDDATLADGWRRQTVSRRRWWRVALIYGTARQRAGRFDCGRCASQLSVGMALRVACGGRRFVARLTGAGAGGGARRRGRCRRRRWWWEQTEAHRSARGQRLSGARADRPYRGAGGGRQGDQMLRVAGDGGRYGERMGITPDLQYKGRRERAASLARLGQPLYNFRTLADCCAGFP